MSKHTPGPWEVRHRPHGAWTVYAPAIGTGDERFYNGEWLHEGPSEANARLIAAAPSLLEALKGVMAYADPYAVPGCDENEMAYEVARTAIAKAEELYKP